MEWFVIKSIGLLYWLETLTQHPLKEKKVEEYLIATTFYGWEMKKSNYSLKLIPKVAFGLTYTYALQDLSKKRWYPASRIGFTFTAHHKKIPFDFQLESFYRSPAKELWILSGIGKEISPFNLNIPIKLNLGTGCYINNNFAFGSLKTFKGFFISTKIKWKKFSVKFSFFSQSEKERWKNYELYQPPLYHIGVSFHF